MSIEREGSTYTDPIGYLRELETRLSEFLEELDDGLINYLGSKDVKSLCINADLLMNCLEDAREFALAEREEDYSQPDVGAKVL